VILASMAGVTEKAFMSRAHEKRLKLLEGNRRDLEDGHEGIRRQTQWPDRRAR